MNYLIKLSGGTYLYGITKFVDISNLPHKPNNSVDWKQSVGYECNFIYGDLSGKIKILDYYVDTNKLLLQYNDTTKIMNCGGFRVGTIGELLKVFTSDFQYDIGDVLHQKHQDIKLIDRWYIKQDGRNRKYYKYECLTCGAINETSEATLRQSKGCPVCRNRKVVVGINDIPTTDPWMIEYFPGGYDEAVMYTNKSSQRIAFICPMCKEQSKRKLPINKLWETHNCCCKCNIHYSIPERVMHNLLNQFGIDFIHGYSKSDASWCDRYRYDFYIHGRNCIIETHGEQHYSESHSNRWGRSYEEEHNNDIVKRNLATSNGVEHYFEIDCRKSNVDWILQSCKSSGLFEFLHIDDTSIDTTSLLYDVFFAKRNQYINIVMDDPLISISEIADIMHISPESVKSIIGSFTKDDPISIMIRDAHEKMIITNNLDIEDSNEKCSDVCEIQNLPADDKGPCEDIIEVVNSIRPKLNTRTCKKWNNELDKQRRKLQRLRHIKEQNDRREQKLLLREERRRLEEERKNLRKAERRKVAEARKALYEEQCRLREERRKSREESRRLQKESNRAKLRTPEQFKEDYYKLLEERGIHDTRYDYNPIEVYSDGVYICSFTSYKDMQNRFLYMTGDTFGLAHKMHEYINTGKIYKQKYTFTRDYTTSRRDVQC